MTHSEQHLSNIFNNFDLLKRQLWKSHGQHLGCSVTRAQLGLMTFIDDKGEQSISQMATQWEMSSSAVTQLVDTLVELGFVQRKQAKDDRRKLRISLTKAGRTMLTKAKKARLELLQKLLSPLSAEELASLEIMQKKILDTFKKS